MKTIGILGSGDVGKTLAMGWAQVGHKVKIGSRTPEKLAQWSQSTGISADTFADAAAFGEVIVLATLWSGTQHALQLTTNENLANKVVIDVTNPLIFAPNQPPALELGHTDSGGEQVQRWLPNSQVVKAFNTIGFAHMVNPNFPSGPPDMFICGNNGEAKQVVSGLCQELGWATIDIGTIAGARLLEPMCILWVSYGLTTGTWNHAFKLLRK